MKIIIFLAAVSAANIFVAVEGYFPTSKIEPCGVNGYQITFGTNPGITNFSVHINKNRPLKVGQFGAWNAWIDSPENGEWIFKVESANLKPKDTIDYWTIVRFKKFSYRSEVKRFEVHLADGPSSRPSSGK